MTEVTKSTAQGVFIDNQWIASKSGKTIDVVAPAEGVVFAEIAAGNAQDVDAAVVSSPHRVVRVVS